MSDKETVKTPIGDLELTRVEDDGVTEKYTIKFSNPVAQIIASFAVLLAVVAMCFFVLPLMVIIICIVVVGAIGFLIINGIHDWWKYR